MKTLISASILAIGLFAGAANAASPVFDDINTTAPRSGTFEDLKATAPRGTFEDINATAPRAGVFNDINRVAPRSDGVYGGLEQSAP
ncbi:MAG: hypothetical protein ACKVP3_20310 [Hyphomicrobiaceae bacterium]